MPRLLCTKMIQHSRSMKKYTLRNAISNKKFDAEYFYNIVWRDFTCQVIFYWPAVEPLADACRALGFRGTLVENHCSGVMLNYAGEAVDGYTPRQATACRQPDLWYLQNLGQAHCLVLQHRHPCHSTQSTVVAEVLLRVQIAQ